MHHAVCVSGLCYLCAGVNILLPNNIYTAKHCSAPARFDYNLSIPHNVERQAFTIEGTGSLIITGSHVKRRNVNVRHKILIVGDGSNRATNINAADVTCTSCPVAIVALGGLNSHPHTPLNIAGLTLSNVEASDEPKFSAALAHTEGIFSCNTKHTHVLVQPSKLSDPSSGTGCIVTDLSAILNVFGRGFMVNIYDKSSPSSTLFNKLAFYGLILLVITLTLAYASAKRVTPESESKKER